MLLTTRIVVASIFYFNHTHTYRILPLIENHHFLLCTLLLFNAAANEALPIFLDAIMPAWAAGITSIFDLG